MMRFKNMLKCFGKIELQEDKTHPTYLSQTILNRLFGRVLEREGALGIRNDGESVIQRVKSEESQNQELLRFAQNDERFSLAPMWEREELLCERSELSNSGEGCKDLPSPDRHPLPREGNKVSCAEHTAKDFSPFTSHFSQICTPHPSPLPQGAREQLLCAEHTEKNLFSYLPIHLFTSKKVAFTLAEVLITLAIIGVVAAMTLPALIQKYQMKSFEVAFKKEYSVIQNTIDYLTLENSISECAFDGIKNGGYTSVTEDCEALYDGLISQLKLSKINKNFSYAKKADVFANGGEAINDVSYDHFQQRANIYTLPDGAIVLLYTQSNNFFEICIVLDVNGLKGPNKWGYDAFFMTLVKHNNKLLLTDEYVSIIEKGGKYPRTILRNQDTNSSTNGWKW